jgi:hypothetical protein
MGGLRGMFAGDPAMTVDKFLERKRADEAVETSGKFHTSDV